MTLKDVRDIALEEGIEVVSVSASGKPPRKKLSFSYRDLLAVDAGRSLDPIFREPYTRATGIWETIYFGEFETPQWQAILDLLWEAAMTK